MFVVVLAGLQAVVELAEELVEQVPLGLVVPVSGGAAGVEVAAGSRGGTQRGQRPDRADEYLSRSGHPVALRRKDGVAIQKFPPSSRLHLRGKVWDKTTRES